MNFYDTLLRPYLGRTAVMVWLAAPLLAMVAAYIF